MNQSNHISIRIDVYSRNKFIMSSNRICIHCGHLYVGINDCLQHSFIPFAVDGVVVGMADISFIPENWDGSLFLQYISRYLKFVPSTDWSEHYTISLPKYYLFQPLLIHFVNNISMVYKI